MMWPLTPTLKVPDVLGLFEGAVLSDLVLVKARKGTLGAWIAEEKRAHQHGADAFADRRTGIGGLKVLGNDVRDGKANDRLLQLLRVDLGYVEYECYLLAPGLLQSSSVPHLKFHLTDVPGTAAAFKPALNTAKTLLRSPSLK